jgi:hypothetical protein
MTDNMAPVANQLTLGGNISHMIKPAISKQGEWWCCSRHGPYLEMYVNFHFHTPDHFCFWGKNPK